MDKLHHVGVVVRNIEETADRYGKILGLARASEIFQDEVQKVKIVFLGGSGSGATLELLEATSPDSPVAELGRKGGGLHHVCYEVTDLYGTVERLRSQRAIIVCEPVPAVAFGGRLVAFVYTATTHLVEFVEAGPAKPGNHAAASVANAQ